MKINPNYGIYQTHISSFIILRWVYIDCLQILYNIFVYLHQRKQEMQQRDDSDFMPLNYLNNANDSLNQTAVSIQQRGVQLQVLDQDGQAQYALKQFYSSQLRIPTGLRFDQLQKDSSVFENGIIGIYPPQPLVYFLPYTILVRPKQKLDDIRQRILNKYRKQIQSKQIKLNLLADSKDQLSISLHSFAEMVYYKIRRVQVNTEDHVYVDCLDKDILVDRLFNFYKIAYRKFHFEEVAVFVMYWAYIRRFLNEDYISPSAMKMLIICLFLNNFGYGIENVLESFQKKFWQKQRKCLQMARTNRKGQCIIQRDILSYRNYSIVQKKGFYILSQKKYQLIRLIQPIYYPIGQRDQKSPYIFSYRQDQLKYFQKTANKKYENLLQRNVKISRYSLLILLFKNMHKYFNYPNKLIFDIKRHNLIFEENSNEFLLEIQHPVFNQCISKGLAENGSGARRIRSELNQITKEFKDNQRAIENLLYLLSRK